MVTFKVSFGKELRRFSNIESDVSFDAFMAAVSSALEVPKQNINLSYIDDEGDKCVVRGNEELREAIRFFANTPSVKFTAEATGEFECSWPSSDEGSPRIQSSVSASESLAAIHYSENECSPYEGAADLSSLSLHDTKKLKKNKKFSEPKPSVQFLRDVTLPEGSSVTPSSIAVKTWELKNNGNIRWPEDCKLAYFKCKSSKNRLRPESDKMLSIPALLPGESASISFSLQVPGKQHLGCHTANFELLTPDGVRFEGDSMLVVTILVELPLPALSTVQILKLVEQNITQNGVLNLEFRCKLNSILEANPVPVVHDGISCDGCMQYPLLGTRYRCMLCEDYDLCQACEANGVHPADHPVIKVRQPLNEAASPMPPSNIRAYVPAPNSWRGRGGRHQGASMPSQECAFKRHPMEKSWRAGSVASSVGNEGQEKCVSLPAAEFVNDANLPDGSFLVVGCTMKKSWSLKNSGDAVWPEDTTLVHVNGAIGPAPGKSAAVPRAKPGETVEVSIEVMIPPKPGRYSGYFRLMSLHRGAPRRFGPRVWLDINATAEAPFDANVQVVQSEAAPSYAAELEVLNSLGFNDYDNNTKLLGLAQGDVHKVVNWLLARPLQDARN